MGEKCRHPKVKILLQHYLLITGDMEVSQKHIFGVFIFTFWFCIEKVDLIMPSCNFE